MQFVAKIFLFVTQAVNNVTLSFNMTALVVEEIKPQGDAEVEHVFFAQTCSHTDATDVNSHGPHSRVCTVANGPVAVTESSCVTDAEPETPRQKSQPGMRKIFEEFL